MSECQLQKLEQERSELEMPFRFRHSLVLRKMQRRGLHGHTLSPFRTCSQVGHEHAAVARKGIVLDDGGWWSMMPACWSCTYTFT